MPRGTARVGLSAGAYRKAFDQLTAGGYRLVTASGCSVGGEDRSVGLREKREGPAWEARHGLTDDAYQKEFDRLAADGYRPVSVSSYRVGGDR